MTETASGFPGPSILYIFQPFSCTVSAVRQKPVFILRVYKSGKFVKIDIEDNGAGMDEETGKRLFEPFFTTKSVDAGTGLGLSVSFFIVRENHNGSIEVRSSPGNGATFTISLPR